MYDLVFGLPVLGWSFVFEEHSLPSPQEVFHSFGMLRILRILRCLRKLKGEHRSVFGGSAIQLQCELFACTDLSGFIADV